MGHPVRAVALDAAFKIDLGQVRGRGEGRRARLLLQPEQPDGDLRRRAGDARVPRQGQPRVARHDDPGRRGVLRLRHRSGSRHAHPGWPSRTRRSSSRARSRRRTAWRDCAWATRSATRTRSRRWPTGTAAPARARSTCWRMHAGTGGDPAGRGLHRRRARAQQGGPRLHDEVVRRSRHEADRLAGQLHVRQHRPPGARTFRDACRAKGVLVARDFPPFEKTHCRISFGTMEEMQKAVAVFGEVLGKKPASGGVDPIYFGQTVPWSSS